MTLNVEKELAALGRLTVAELRLKHAEVFGEPNRSCNKEYLVKRIVWRMQANAYGGLSERARQRAEELANDADLRTTAPKVRKPEAGAPVAKAVVPFARGSRLPMAGGNLTRRYKGRDIVVRVRPKGFEYEGTIYRTLSAVATAVTGSHWNGYHFFKLNSEEAADE